jgi:hypothetical protein
MAILLVSVDFIVVSIKARSTVDAVHYVAILFWVLANALWAYCDLGFVLFKAYDDDDKIPYPLWHGAPSVDGSYDYDGNRSNNEPWIHGRWWGTWLMMVNCALLVGFYALWLGLTIKHTRNEDDKQSKHLLYETSINCHHKPEESSPGLTKHAEPLMSNEYRTVVTDNDFFSVFSSPTPTKAPLENVEGIGSSSNGAMDYSQTETKH